MARSSLRVEHRLLEDRLRPPPTDAPRRQQLQPPDAEVGVAGLQRLGAERRWRPCPAPAAARTPATAPPGSGRPAPARRPARPPWRSARRPWRGPGGGARAVCRTRTTAWPASGRWRRLPLLADQADVGAERQLLQLPRRVLRDRRRPAAGLVAPGGDDVRRSGPRGRAHAWSQAACSLAVRWGSSEGDAGLQLRRAEGEQCRPRARHWSRRRRPSRRLLVAAVVDQLRRRRPGSAAGSAKASSARAAVSRTRGVATDRQASRRAGLPSWPSTPAASAAAAPGCGSASSASSRKTTSWSSPAGPSARAAASCSSADSTAAASARRRARPPTASPA